MIQSKVEGDEVKGKIVQNNGLFRFPLEVGILKTDGKWIKEKILVQGKETGFTFKMPGIKTVVLDPDTRLFYSERSK
jgi:hypothetical protein